MLDKLIARVAELEKAVESSAGNHNAMVGMLMEARLILKTVQDDAPVVEQVIEAVAELIE